MFNSIKKIFAQRTDYKKLKKEISPVPSKFIKDLRFDKLTHCIKMNKSDFKVKK